MFLKLILSGLIISFITLVPLTIKWQLDKRHSLLALPCIGIFSGSIAYGLNILLNIKYLHLLAIEFVIIFMTSVTLLLWRFYRDPERLPPEGEENILSPADGTVIYVKKIQRGEIPLSQKKGTRFSLTEFVQHDMLPAGGYLIGIAMNFLDVHVNRAPIEGEITLLKHIKGLFVSMKKKEAILQNERVITIITNRRVKVGIVQIASRLVRKIVPFLQEGDLVQRGQRFGMIRFGSQVDLILPEVPSLRIDVTPGQKVKAGLSILGKIDND